MGPARDGGAVTAPGAGRPPGRRRHGSHTNGRHGPVALATRRKDLRTTLRELVDEALEVVDVQDRGDGALIAVGIAGQGRPVAGADADVVEDNEARVVAAREAEHGVVDWSDDGE